MWASPAFATALASAESFFSPSPTSTSTVVGSRGGEVRLDLLDVRAFHASTPSTMTARDSPPKRPSELQAATASSPEVSDGVELLGRVLTDPRPQPLQRQRDLRPVAPREEVDRLQLALARHAAKHRRRPRPHPGRARRPRGRRDLRAGHAPERARTRGDEPGAPAVELRQRRRDRWRDRRDAAVRSASPSTSTTTGTATTFAGTVTSEIWWNCSHVTGAVARPHAVDTPISCASSCDTG